MNNEKPMIQPGEIEAPLSDVTISKGHEEYKKKKSLHLILMVLGWSNLGLGLTILLVTIIIGIYSAITLSVNPCPTDCFYSRTIPVISSFMFVIISLFEFWGASRLEPDSYADTGMWVSLITMVPFLGYILYLVASK